MSKETIFNLTLFKRLISYIKPYKRIFLFSLLCTLLLAAVSPFRPIIIGRIVSDYIVRDKSVDLLLKWTIVVVILLLFEAVLNFLSSYFSNLLAQSIIRDLRKKMVGHILLFNTKYFDKTPVGAMVTRVVSDIEAISEVFSAGLMEIFSDLLTLIVVLCAMLYLNWELTLLTMIPIPILFFATRIFAKAMQASFQLERQQVTRLNTFVQERITGISIVQLFGRQKKEMESFDEINNVHRQAHVKAVWANSIFFPIVELLSSLSIAFLLVYGALRYSGKSSGDIQLMVGEVVGFTLFINMMFRPIRQLADKFNVLQRGIVRADRVFAVMDLNEEVQSSGHLLEVDFKQDVHFKDVSFAYVDEQFVLKNINLDIESGSTIAFVGATGAGKSSMINLLSRLYDFQKGEISIGDVDIKDIDLELLRKNIAVVLQDVFLFSDTIHNNITLGDTSISRAQVIEAAKSVGAHDFIMELPDGYDFEVGERGGVMSVGQRQLLSFIRAVVYNPQILVLDEATSSIDNESEELIQKATEVLTSKEHFAGRTTIIIAHRLSTIQKADKIIVLDKGQIIEQGSHSELLKQNGAYKKLYDMQFN
ncbi:MAG: ABC transporter ATP-binding protein [Bacteroidota bacterium]